MIEMPLKNQFKNLVGERVISSYDFLDLVSGRAIQTMYLGTVRKTVSGTESYIINESPFWSVSTSMSANLAYQVNPTKILDKDFDINIDKQCIGGGECLLSASYGWTGTAGFDHTMYLLVKIRHYDGSTETELISAKSTTLSGVNPSNRVDTVFFTIPKTKFSQNDTLRITIELWATNLDGGNTATYIIGTDPKDRAVEGICASTSQIITQIPFKIDL